MSREFPHRASLALNLLLAVTIVALVLGKSPRAPAPSADVNPAKSPNELPVTRETPIITAQPKLLQYPDNGSASDRRRWVEQLRAAGVPNKILARVVLADLDDDWDRRIEECHGDADKMAALQ